MKVFLRISVFLAIIFTYGCQDEDEATPEELASIRATLNLRDENGDITTTNWSLERTNAVRTNGEIILTGRNSSTGEIFRMKVPDDGAQYYANTSANNDLGSAIWRIDEFSPSWYSYRFPSGVIGDFVLDITEINESNNTISGSFFTSVYSTENSQSAFFQNGRISRVPIVNSLEEEAITENKFSVRVSGINFNAVDINPMSQNNSIIVRATNAAGLILELSIPSELDALEELEIGTGANQVAAYYQNPSFDPQLAREGRLIIDTHNTTDQSISGRFEFMAGPESNPTIAVTDGEFEILY
jgi:hypothetical protein